MKTIIEMAREAGIYVPEHLQTIATCKTDLGRFSELVFEQGRQEGMKQERALWTLTKLGQEIEAQPEQEPVARVIEELEHDGQGWCSKVRWLYNPVPVGETLFWKQPK